MRSPVRSPPPREVAPALESAAADAADATRDPQASEVEIPTSCDTTGSATCAPPATLARELCKRSSVDLALVMFQKTSPWKRAYLRGDTPAWLAGSHLADQALLRFDEEVIVVGNRTATSGIQVGGGSYDVLRWDGTCFSVMADEVTFQRPPQPLNAPIEWRHLSDDMREVLLRDRKIKAAYDRFRSRCKEDGAAPACDAARDELGRIIADHVRKGAELPGRRIVMSG
jgi:hypothetical protein